MREALLDLLDEAGFLACAFASGEEFLESGCQYRVFVPDYGHPYAGHVWSRSAGPPQRRRLRVPIIFITAHGDERMRMQALRAGAVEFLAKPFDDEVLLKTVRAALERCI